MQNMLLFFVQNGKYIVLAVGAALSEIPSQEPDIGQLFGPVALWTTFFVPGTNPGFFFTLHSGGLFCPCVCPCDKMSRRAA